MSGRHSKEKGKRGERQIVKLLKQYLPGAFARNRAGTKGDDITVPEDFAYSIEIKFDYQHIKLQHLILPTQEVIGWWRQCERQANNKKRKPLLVVKLSGVWWCTTVSPEWWQCVGLQAQMATVGWCNFESFLEELANEITTAADDEAA